LDAALEAAQVCGDLGDRAGVVLLDRELVQLAGVGEGGGELPQAGDGFLQRGALAAQGLRAPGVVPDARLLQLAVDLRQALGLGLVVKGTSSAPRRARSGRRSSAAPGCSFPCSLPFRLTRKTRHLST